MPLTLRKSVSLPSMGTVPVTVEVQDGAIAPCAAVLKAGITGLDTSFTDDFWPVLNETYTGIFNPWRHGLFFEWTFPELTGNFEKPRLVKEHAAKGYYIGSEIAVVFPEQDDRVPGYTDYTWQLKVTDPYDGKVGTASGTIRVFNPYTSATRIVLVNVDGDNGVGAFEAFDRTNLPGVTITERNLGPGERLDNNSTIITDYAAEDNVRWLLKGYDTTGGTLNPTYDVRVQINDTAFGSNPFFGAYGTGKVRLVRSNNSDPCYAAQGNTDVTTMWGLRVTRQEYIGPVIPETTILIETGEFSNVEAAVFNMDAAGGVWYLIHDCAVRRNTGSFVFKQGGGSTSPFRVTASECEMTDAVAEYSFLIGDNDLSINGGFHAIGCAFIDATDKLKPDSAHQSIIRCSRVDEIIITKCEVFFNKISGSQSSGKLGTTSKNGVSINVTLNRIEASQNGWSLGWTNDFFVESNAYIGFNLFICPPYQQTVLYLSGEGVTFVNNYAFHPAWGLSDGSGDSISQGDDNFSLRNFVSWEFNRGRRGPRIGFVGAPNTIAGNTLVSLLTSAQHGTSLNRDVLPEIITVVTLRDNTVGLTFEDGSTITTTTPTPPTTDITRFNSTNVVHAPRYTAEVGSPTVDRDPIYDGLIADDTVSSTGEPVLVDVDDAPLTPRTTTLRLSDPDNGFPAGVNTELDISSVEVPAPYPRSGSSADRAGRAVYPHLPPLDFLLRPVGRNKSDGVLEVENGGNYVSQ